MTFSFRPAVTADRPMIEAASCARWDIHRARQLFAFPENGWDLLLDRDDESTFWCGTGQAMGQSGNMFIADADGAAVGFILFSWHLCTDATNGIAIDIRVHSDWRAKGKRRALVENAKILAGAADWDNRTAKVRDGAPSEELFDAAGVAPHHVTWRYGPDRPATLLKPRAKKVAKDDKRWKWVALVLSIALPDVLMAQQ